MKRILTTCGYCGCGCNFYVNVKNNQVIGVSPKPNHPVSKGKLCIKGWKGHSFVNHPDRLKTPLIKQADGTFKESSWEEALSYIVKSFKKIISEKGSDTLGIFSSARCTNEENYLLVKFARSVLKTNNIDHCARL